MANEYLNNKNFESIITSFQQQKRLKSRREYIIADVKETYQRRLDKYNDDLRKVAMEEAVKLHVASCAQYEALQNQLAYSFYLLSENIANYAKFSGVDTDDAIQEGVLICFQKIDLFDCRKGKAFNYMTTCILNHFRQLYRSVRNHNELKKRYHIHLQDKYDNVVVRNGKERSNHKSSIDKDSNLW